MEQLTAGNGAEPNAYGWVAVRQEALMDAHGEPHGLPEVAHEPALDSAAREAEAQTESTPISEQLPMANEACTMLARAARYADYVPDRDRQAFIGGRSARIDRATLEVLEELGGTASQVRSNAAVPIEEANRPRRGVLRSLGAHRARRAADAAADHDAITRETLARLYPDQPERALAILQSGQEADAEAARNAPLVDAFTDDPAVVEAALSGRGNLDPEQQQRLQPHEVDNELGMLRQQWAERRGVGLGLSRAQSARYADLEGQRAARAFDIRGDIAERDLRAQQQAALTEALERNRPDGKVLVVTDENISTPGLAGPFVAYYGAAEIHTAGVPYHKFTKDFLESVTGSIFRDQLAYNDVNQQYELILLQGQFPPIKPIELMIQIGARGADMGIIPGDVDQSFVDELRRLIHDEQSVYHGQYQLVERPSELVTIDSSDAGQPAATTLKGYTRPTLLLLRGQSVGDNNYVFTSTFALAA